VRDVPNLSTRRAKDVRFVEANPLTDKYGNAACFMDNTHAGCQIQRDGERCPFVHRANVMYPVEWPVARLANAYGGFTWQVKVTQEMLRKINDSIDLEKTEVEGPNSFAAYRAAWKKGTRISALGHYDKEAEKVSYDTWRDEIRRTGDHKFCWACGEKDHPTAMWFKNCGETLNWEKLKENYAKAWNKGRTFEPMRKGGKKWQAG
jgi:hypothetical protein